MFEDRKPRTEAPPERDPLMDRMVKESRADMVWESAVGARVVPEAYYLVKTNAGEWGDHDLAVLRGTMLTFRLSPHYVRGCPVWIAKISDPEAGVAP